MAYQVFEITYCLRYYQKHSTVTAYSAVIYDAMYYLYWSIVVYVRAFKIDT